MRWLPGAVKWKSMHPETLDALTCLRRHFFAAYGRRGHERCYRLADSADIGGEKHDQRSGLEAPYLSGDRRGTGKLQVAGSVHGVDPGHRFRVGRVDGVDLARP